MTDPKSKYEIVMAPDRKSFVVRGRTSVTISLANGKAGLNVFESGKSHNYMIDYPYFNYREILSKAVEIIMTDWQPKDSKSRFFITKWARTQTSKAIGKRFCAAWRELLTQVDPTILAAQRAVFAANGKILCSMTDLKFYQNEYYIKDIVKYRAAALTTEYYNDYSNSWNSNSFPSWDQYNSENRVSDWKSLYSNTNHSYTSLNKTLMNFPGGIPGWLAQNLRRFKLERPITNRLELLGLLCSRYDRHTHIFMHATDKELRKAISAYAGSRREKPNFRKVQYIQEAIQFACDYPEVHNGNCIGLFEKSHHWHREANYSSYKRQCELPLETPTAIPPIELPKIKGIEFLSTIDKVFEESNSMKHCIYSYISNAIKGNCFLFHIDYKGEKASAEITWNGQLNQIRGPRNCENKATKWGKKQLLKWIENWPKGIKKDKTENNLLEDIPF